MSHRLSTSYLEDSVALFRYYKKLGEDAMAQVTDEQLFAVLDPEMNSIAIIVKHMAGNMCSRWTDFLATDGEKPDRDRDSEFTTPSGNRGAILKSWQHGWGLLFAALGQISDPQMSQTVTIRGEPHSVMQAINRQVAHYAYHVGQIVLLAKHFRHKEWKSLSVPRGKSAEFNHAVETGKTSQR